MIALVVRTSLANSHSCKGAADIEQIIAYRDAFKAQAIRKKAAVRTLKPRIKSATDKATPPLSDRPLGDLRWSTSAQKTSTPLTPSQQMSNGHRTNLAANSLVCCKARKVMSRVMSSSVKLTMPARNKQTKATSILSQRRSHFRY
jgi:hypothetical protein